MCWNDITDILENISMLGYFYQDDALKSLYGPYTELVNEMASLADVLYGRLMIFDTETEDDLPRLPNVYWPDTAFQILSGNTAEEMLMENFCFDSAMVREREEELAAPLDKLSRAKLRDLFTSAAGFLGDFLELAGAYELIQKLAAELAQREKLLECR